MNKKCKKCKEIKSLEDYYNAKTNKDGKHGTCKICMTAKNKRTFTETYQLPYYIVYYLPEENYCGITRWYEKRLMDHKNLGKNIKGAKVLFATSDKVTAHYYEALYHSTLAMKGLKII